MTCKYCKKELDKLGHDKIICAFRKNVFSPFNFNCGSVKKAFRILENKSEYTFLSYDPNSFGYFGVISSIKAFSNISDGYNLILCFSDKKETLDKAMLIKGKFQKELTLEIFESIIDRY